MLAIVNPSQHDVSLRQHSHIDPKQELNNSMSDHGALEDHLCPGCKKSAVTEHGGLVIAFGQSFFHVDCFKCAKCGDQVNADTNLLLLSDGSPICAKCSYNCNVCRLPILDEAIMTGDDSYHAHCFKCKVCKRRIDELVFAKTSQGIYCMSCHNERMIKIRKHTQKKAEREREKLAGGSGSTRSRERDARNYHRENGRSSPAMDTSKSEGFYSPASSRHSSYRSPDIASHVRSPEKPSLGQYVSDAFATPPQILASTTEGHSRPALSTSSSSQSFSVTVAPPELEHFPRSDFPVPAKQNPAKQATLPIPNVSVDVDHSARRRSYDDGVRPLDVLFKHKGDPIQQLPNIPTTAPVSSEGLAVTTSRRDKRNSINPAFSLSDFNPLIGVPTVSPTPSPRSASFVVPDHSLIPGEKGSPYTASSPLHEHYNPRSPAQSRPTSHGSSHLSQSSHPSSPTGLPYSEEFWQDQSQPSSPSGNMDDHDHDQTIIVNSIPSTVTLGSVPSPKAQHSTQGFGGTPFSDINGSHINSGSSMNSGSRDIETLRAHKSFDDRHHPGSRPDSGSLSLHSITRSRPVSPAHRADVPSNVESETETDLEGEINYPKLQIRESVAPMPPPKEKTSPFQSADIAESTASDSDADPTAMSPNGSDEMSESSPVEGISHSTFIAPALPPIRISMNTADFSELLNSVRGFPTVKSLAKISEDILRGDLTPPPTASIEGGLTPTSSSTTLLPPTYEHIEVPNLQEGDDNVDRNMLDSIQTPTLPPKPTKVKGIFLPPDASKASNSTHLPRPLNSGDSGHSTITETNKSFDMSGSKNSTHITLTEPESTVVTTLKDDTKDLVTLRLQEVIADVRVRGAQHLTMDRGFVEVILSTLESRNAEYQQLKRKFDGIKRTSKHYIEGLTVAQTEYDQELKARRDAEAEVTRLRVLLSGQIAKLTAMSSETRKEELRQQLSKDLHASLSNLEQDLSNLKVERDITLAEVEELSLTKNTVVASPETPPLNLGRALTKRLDSIKSRYQRELVPLTKEREGLIREIAELKDVRDVFLEETTILNARNEELAQLSAVYSRRVESAPETTTNNYNDTFRGSLDRARHQHQQHQHHQQAIPLPPSLSSSTSGSSTFPDDSTIDTRHMRVHKSESDHPTPSKGKFKWPGSKAKEVLSPPAHSDRKAHLEHNFQQLSILRFTRCDHCGDKMWGSQLRCTVCPTSIHVRCIAHLQLPCTQQNTTGPRAESPPIPMLPSMFGRELVEQVQADSKDEERKVPIIVEKCIDAVETVALDYEGIYRKSGGSSQTKAITQLFERGDYSFDLRDSDRFNDICSVTSVLKNYFRSLPIPLLTFDLHDEFMTAVHLQDPAVRHGSLLGLVKKLPDEHYYTLRMLMLHLHRVCERSEKNLMNARNLGVVFGPTLMRSRDPNGDFRDMAGKALSIEWLVDNAPSIFG